MPTGMISSPELPRRKKFQSLFFWMMPTGLMDLQIAFGHCQVSILVLLDDAYRQKVWPSCLPGYFVSILVLLDDAYRLFYDLNGNKIAHQVSILVLLDDAYRQSPAGALQGCMNSFNPCSSGWCLPAISYDANDLPSESFNPCSSGWCLPAVYPLLKYGKRICFNPCSSGWCLPAKDEEYFVDENDCFNPCSSGWCLPALVYWNNEVFEKLFQSLFFWMMPTGPLTIE